MEANVRARFVRDTLSAAGEKTERLQRAAISRQTLTHTGTLMNGRRREVVSADGTMDGRLTIVHPAYERFLDIRRPGRKRRRLHNRFAFGIFGDVSWRLMYGLTEEVAADIREALRRATG